MRSTTSALLLFVCISKDANILKCAGAALTTAVFKLQRDVTELKSYSEQSNATGKLSKNGNKNRTLASRTRHKVYST